MNWLADKSAAHIGVCFHIELSLLPARPIQ
jgi:hypothetical protein